MHEKVPSHTEDLSPYCPVFPMQKLYVSKSAWHERKDHSFHKESDRSTQALCSCANAENMTPPEMTGVERKHLLRRQHVHRRHKTFNNAWKLILPLEHVAHEHPAQYFPKGLNFFWQVMQHSIHAQDFQASMNFKSSNWTEGSSPVKVSRPIETDL